jgi:hypothetical protein
MEEVRKTAREMVRIIESEGSEGETTYSNLGKPPSLIVSLMADTGKEGQQAKVTGADLAEDVFGINYRKLQRIKTKYE